MEFTEENIDNTKETILHTSPLLRTFLNLTAMKRNYEGWKNDLDAYENLLLNRMNLVLGNNWDKITLQPLLINDSIYKILRLEMLKTEKFRLLRRIITIGFEVGTEDTNLIAPNILEQMSATRSLNPACFNDRQKSLEAANFVLMLLATGVYYRGIADKPSNNPFKDLINSLDF